VVRTINPSVLQIEAELEGSSTTPDRVLECWVPLLKGGRTDGLIRQLTELGASKICVFLSERSEVRPNAPARTKQLERFRRLSDESTRQCRRTDRVAIENHGALPQDGPGFFLWEEGGAPLAEVMAGLDDDPIRVLVGPEGGLSASEASALEACGWRAVHLGGRILRAETAVLAAATLVIYGAQS
jgi:16S rRNA (uracil1498-N3)-methyltransferase